MSYPTPPPTAAPIQPPAPPVQPGPPFRLPAGRRRTVVAELLKIWTTNTWWVLSICYAVGLGLTILVNTFTANDNINTASRSIGSTDGLSGDEIQKLNLAHDLPLVVRNAAADIYTSGQYFGALVVLLLGILIVTNEFNQQTATATFLATPIRFKVVLAKITAVLVVAVGLWLVTTLIDLLVGASFFSNRGFDSGLDQWPIQRAILLNLLAFALWAMFGVGFGLVLRNQTAAVLVGAGLYLIGTVAAQVASLLLFAWLKEDWLLQAKVVVPTVASSVMVAGDATLTATPTDLGLVLQPAWWVGALILLGWGGLAALVGIAITQTRDIS